MIAVTISHSHRQPWFFCTLSDGHTESIMNHMPINTIVADDHTLVRRGIVGMIAGESDFNVVGEAACGTEVLGLLEKTSADLLILDITMPGISGIELIKRLSRDYPKLPILVLSMHDEISLVGQILSMGASGYLTKHCAPKILLAAARKVASGGRFVEHELADKLLFSNANGADAPHHSLSEREMQVLRLIVEGHGLNNIASILSVSPKTISTHKTRLMQKLEVQNNTDLIRYALEWKIAAPLVLR